MPAGRKPSGRDGASDAGYSLVELVISIVLLSMLATGGLLLFQMVTSASERTEARASMEEYANAVADELRSIGWSSCYLGGQGGLRNYFRDSLAGRMDASAGPNPVEIPEHTQDPDLVDTWQVWPPVIDEVALGAGMRSDAVSDTWTDIPEDDDGDPGDPEGGPQCAYYSVARVTFTVTNYDPSLADRPSIPIELTRQVLIPRS